MRYSKQRWHGVLEAQQKITIKMPTLYLDRDIIPKERMGSHIALKYKECGYLHEYGNGRLADLDSSLSNGRRLLLGCLNHTL